MASKGSKECADRQLHSARGQAATEHQFRIMQRPNAAMTVKLEV